MRPAQNDYPAFANDYVSLVKGNTVAEVITIHNDELLHFVESIPDTKANYSYAENKWSVKEVIQHLIDTERIFSYRALALARGEKQSLPGFQQNDCATNSFANMRAFSDLKEEYITLRISSNILFRSFNHAVLKIRGLINSYETTCLGMIYMTFGHALHHKNLLLQKYL